MANEINISASISAQKNGVSMSQSGSKAIDMAGDDMLQATQLVGTSAEAIGFGEITGAPASVFLQSVETVNVISYGPSNPPTEFVLKPGRIALFEPTAATQYAIATPGAGRMYVFAVEA